MKSPLRTEVTAIAPSTLLKLDEARFRKLLDRSPALRQVVRDGALKRGIDPDGLDMKSAPNM